jgi:hypothetical protein
MVVVMRQRSTYSSKNLWHHVLVKYSSIGPNIYNNTVQLSESIPKIAQLLRQEGHSPGRLSQQLIPHRHWLVADSADQHPTHITIYLQQCLTKLLNSYHEVNLCITCQMMTPVLHSLNLRSLMSVHTHVSKTPGWHWFPMKIEGKHENSQYIECHEWNSDWEPEECKSDILQLIYSILWMLTLSNMGKKKTQLATFWNQGKYLLQA